MKYRPEVDDTGKLEKYLGLPKHSLKNIPVYAREEALTAIKNVLELENKKLFRRGIYYITLVDLCKNTSFQRKYGDDLTDIRVQWFQTAVIKALGEIKLENYVNFNKTIGDASLLIFSSFHDVLSWNRQLNNAFSYMKSEFKVAIGDSESPIQELLTEEESENESLMESIVEDFNLSARRLVHLGEVKFSDNTDPLALAISQTFKTEKIFSDPDCLGCTQIVANVISPLLRGLGVKLVENRETTIAGEDSKSMTYYLQENRKQLRK